jgi:hypothetical protein
MFAECFSLVDTHFINLSEKKNRPAIFTLVGVEFDKPKDLCYFFVYHPSENLAYPLFEFSSAMSITNSHLRITVEDDDEPFDIADRLKQRLDSTKATKESMQVNGPNY